MGSRVIEGFTPGKTYLFQMYAVNIAGEGPLSAVVEYLIPTYPIPNAPTDVVLTATVVPWVGKKYKVTATLTWTAPTKNSDGGDIVISGYNAELYDNDDPGNPVLEQTKAIPQNVLTYTFTDLNPNMAYKARIQAKCAVKEIGTWSAYATAVVAETTPTNRMPTPIGLTLTQVGTKITARVAAISNITYPEFKGFRWYASKQTGFTPGIGNLVDEKRGVTSTIQEAYDSVDVVIEEINLGDTIYVRVSAYDENGNEGVKCAEVSIVAGGAVPGVPTGLSTATASDETTLNILDAYVDFTWNRIASYFEYVLEYWKTGATYHHVLHIKDPNSGSTITKRVGRLAIGTEYSWQVQTVKAFNIKSAFTVGTPVTTWTPTVAVPDGMSDATGEDESTINLVDAYLSCTWNRVAGCDYEFQYRKTGITTYRTTHIKDPGSGATITETIGKLVAWTVYYWRVRAVKQTMKSAYCAEQNETTWAPAAPNKPTSVKAKVSNDKIEISWATTSEKVIHDYYVMVNTANEVMTLDQSAAPADFAVGATVHGDTSAQTCVIVEKLTSLTYRVRSRSGAFTLGEVLHDGTNSADQGAANPVFSTDSGTAETIKQVKYPQNMTTIMIGSTTTSFTIEYNVPYYFWVMANNKWGVGSLRVATTPTNVMIFKGQELKHFTTPWQMRGMSSQWKRLTAGGTLDRTIPTGKVGLLTGYHIIGDATHYAAIWIMGPDRQIEMVDAAGSAITRSPAFTNGLYCQAGDSFRLIIEVGGTGVCWMRIKEFDADSDIVIITDYVTNVRSYVVPSGKRLIITYLWAIDPGFLQKKEAGTWYDVWDSYNEKWDISKGVLQFIDGDEIGSDGTEITFIGILTGEV